MTNTVGNFTFGAVGESQSVNFPLFAGSVVNSTFSLTLHKYTGAGSATFNFCLQRVLPLPGNSSTWGTKSCSVFTQLTVSDADVSVTLPFLPVASSLGAIFSSGNASSVIVSASASVCAPDHVAVNGACSAVATLQDAVAFTVSNEASTTQQFVANVAQPGSASLVLTFAWPAAAPVAEPTPVAPAPVAPAPVAPAPVEAAPVAPVPVEPAPVAPAPVEPAPVAAAAPTLPGKRAVAAAGVWRAVVRFASAPRLDGTDDADVWLNTTSTVTIPAPQPGSWFVTVLRVDGVVSTYNLTAAVSVCANASQAGPLCTETYAPYLANVTANSVGNAVARNASASGLTLFRIARSSVTGGSIFIAVAGLRPSKFPANVTLYIAVGGAPTLSSPVWTGCDEGPCGTVQAANFSSAITTAGDIWIGVGNVNASDQIIAWRDSVCANNCNAQGTCVEDTSNDKFGQCQCQNLYEGVDCSVKPTGLPIQVIVLIIIGSLLVLTALVGLIAWIVSRRGANRAGYTEVA